jgi:cytochrome c oxidase subunit III
MSIIDPSVLIVPAPDSHAGANHDPNLAHHFDTPEQQYQSGKLGMWMFLGTELLMFGGLFCAYSVYRHNHPEVFEYAHQYLNKWLGGLNTLVLITSSLTMAWGVRAAQMANRKLLMFLLALTLIGAAGFMVIKSIEYSTKWKEKIFLNSENLFRGDAAETKNKAKVADLEDEALGIHDKEPSKPALTQVTPEPADPNLGTPDAAKIVPPNVSPAGLSAAVAGASHHKLSFSELSESGKRRVFTFFSIYFFMTGLHGIHVLVGMGLIFWILYRASSPLERKWVLPSGLAGLGVMIGVIALIAQYNPAVVLGCLMIVAGIVWTVVRRRKAAAISDGDGEFGPKYFTPVDLVGLYWHLVDLIWIFLFPLLYLIH